MVTELIWFLGVGVLLCQGNHLLTGSNTRWLRLWDVEAVHAMKPRDKVCDGTERSVADFLMTFSVTYLGSVLSL